MKNIRVYFLMALIMVGCKKDKLEPVPLTAVNVVNAAINLPQVKVNYFNQIINWSTYTAAGALVNYGANTLYNVPVGTASLNIVPSADTLHPVFNGKINTDANAVYSFYLIGQVPTVDTLLVKETIPYYTNKDSITGVRVINLSPNSTPVNITLSTSTTVNEFSNIGYKQSTEFKQYAAKSTNTTYTFQVRNASNNAILATYAYSLQRFANVTLVIKGLQGTTSGTNAFGVQRVNNY